MNSILKALICFIATIVLAFIGCLNDSSEVIQTVSMIASLVCGLLAVVFINRATGGDSK